MQAVATTGDVVDTEIQADLADALGEAKFRQLVASFARQMPGKTAAIEQAVAARDRQAVVASAHDLRGAANNLGFVGLAHALSGLEAACRDDTAEPAWTALAAPVRAAVAVTQDWLLPIQEGESV